MTRLPFANRSEVKGVLGEAYITPGVCSNPFCGKPGVDKHHIVRRSELGGPYDWVEYNGVRIGNVCLLCRECHRGITENRTMIQWSILGYYEWVDGPVVRKLDPHPPVGTTPDMSGGYKPQPPPDVCPECKRPHRRKGANEQKRERKSWAVHVPADHREDGADVLDTLLEEARKLMAVAGLPYGDEDNARYFVLAATLGLFVQHANEVLGDG